MFGHFLTYCLSRLIIFLHANFEHNTTLANYARIEHTSPINRKKHTMKTFNRTQYDDKKKSLYIQTKNMLFSPQSIADLYILYDFHMENAEMAERRKNARASSTHVD